MKNKNELKKHISSTLNNLGKCINLLGRFDKRIIWIQFLLFTLQGVLPITQMIVFQKIINYIQLRNVTIKFLIFNFIFYMIIGLFNVLIINISGYYTSKINLKFGKFVDLLLLKKASGIEISKYEMPQTYDLIKRANDQSGENVIKAIQIMMEILKNIVITISSIIILSRYNIGIVIMVCIIPIIKYIYVLKIGKEQFGIYKKRTKRERQCWYIEYLFSNLPSMKEIKINRLVQFFLNKYRKLRNMTVKENIYIAKKNFYLNFVLSFMEILLSGIIWGGLFYQGYLGKILLGDITLFGNCTDNVREYINSILLNLSSLFKMSLYLGLFFQFLSIPEKEQENGDEIREIQSIEFRNVSFKYHGAQKETVKNISFKISNGERITIVGRNGSGKSTLIKLILGIYDNYIGEILVNGKEIRSLNKGRFWDNISIVFQDYFKFEGTISENISYGNRGEDVADQRIEVVLKMVGLQKRLTPDTYDKVFGSWFGGAQLSIGEWQRLSIARSFIKECSVYIYDEPDASVDNSSEGGIMQSYLNMTEGKIGILITHNLEKLSKSTDKILVLENGRVVEVGDHMTLIKNKKVYYQLYNNIEGEEE